MQAYITQKAKDTVEDRSNRATTFGKAERPQWRTSIQKKKKTNNKQKLQQKAIKLQTKLKLNHREKMREDDRKFKSFSLLTPDASIVAF